ncbi:MAG: hypothetical protein EZS28_028488, partial [Streblomastix strix]
MRNIAPPLPVYKDDDVVVGKDDFALHYINEALIILNELEEAKFISAKILPPFPPSLTHKQKLHESSRESLPPSLIMAQIAPPLFDSHDVNVVFVNETSLPFDTNTLIAPPYNFSVDLQEMNYVFSIYNPPDIPPMLHSITPPVVYSVQLRVILSNLLYGDKGEYVKGNYSDATSVETDLEGIPLDWTTFTSLQQDEILSLQRKLEVYWSLPFGDIWHISNRDQKILGVDQFQCGEYDEPCKTIEYALKQISVRKGGSEAAEVTEKKIGITEGGFDILTPIDPDIYLTGKLTIVKQLYGTTSVIAKQAEIKILKNNDNNKENGKQGWIQAKGGINLGLYGIDLITDGSTLTIPLLYIEGELIFSSVNIKDISTRSNLIHITTSAQLINIQGSSFEKISSEYVSQLSKSGMIYAQLIVSSGNISISDTNFTECKGSTVEGGALYLVINEGKTVTLKNSQFSKCEAGSGGAIVAQISSGGKLNIDGKCSFTECKATTSGGAISTTVSGQNSLLTLDAGIIFEGCTSRQNGGGAYIQCSNLATFTLNAVEFNNCQGNDGAGIYIHSTSTNKVSLTGTKFTKCVSQSRGGGINLGLYGIDLITDGSTLTIPLLYIEGELIFS